MKNFICKTFLFFIPVIIIIIGCEIYIRTMPSLYKNKKDQLIANADSIEILIMGSSHAMDGVDPIHISLFAYNFALPSQSIYFDRMLIEKYLPELPELKFVLIHFDYTSLYYDHEENRDFFYKHYFGINYDNRKFYKESFLQSFFVYTPEQTLSLMFRRVKDSIVKSRLDSNGRNDLIVTSEERSKLRANSFNSTINNWKGGDSVLNDLEALINILQSRNITPVLISYPHYSTIRQFLDSSIIELNRSIAGSLSQKYQILYLDYFDDDSFTVADFLNSDHLNAEGSAKLSKKIDAEIMNLKAEQSQVKE